MTKRRVARIAIEAVTASFRYPHFLVGRQVTYEMPPPSTIYGHVASALGELPDPASFEFGVDFRFSARCSDLEHQHVITAGGMSFNENGASHRTSVQATVQPHLRDFLFRPRIVLYLSRLDWIESFLSPAFCVVFGRSQDLATVVSVAEVELEERRGAYFEHTIVPFSYRPFLASGSTVMMPRWIEPPPARRAHFERFIVLHNERVFAGTLSNQPEQSASRTIGDPDRSTWWVDPETPIHNGVQRAVLFHSCA